MNMRRCMHDKISALDHWMSTLTSHLTISPFRQSERHFVSFEWIWNSFGKMFFFLLKLNRRTHDGNGKKRQIKRFFSIDFYRYSSIAIGFRFRHPTVPCVRLCYVYPVFFLHSIRVLSRAQTNNLENWVVFLWFLVCLPLKRIFWQLGNWITVTGSHQTEGIYVGKCVSSGY